MLRKIHLAVDFYGRSGLVWCITFVFCVSSGEKNGTPSE